MEFRITWILVFLCPIFVGCRRDPYVDAYFDMLNAEKRILEDRLYEAEYKYEQAQRRLEACRTKPAPGRSDSLRDQDDRRVPPVELPDLPEVELPPGFSQRAPFWPPERLRPVGTGVLPVTIARSDRDGSAHPEPLAAAVSSPQPLDEHVVAIHLNPRATGGIDLDGVPGDDGLSVLIEPRNAQGQFVAQPAALSIVLLDPLEREQRARFARWDFDRFAAQRMMRSQGLDRGLHVQVPWPENAPTTDRLHLFVRYTTDDQRTLEADREITIRSPGLVADRWTPRAENTVSRTAGRTQPQPQPQPQRQHPPVDSQVIPASHESPFREDRTTNPAPQPPSTAAPSQAKSHHWSPER
jgi:hypothetical protein